MAPDIITIILQYCGVKREPLWPQLMMNSVSNGMRWLGTVGAQEKVQIWSESPITAHYLVLMIVLDMFVDCFVPFRVPRPLLSSRRCSIISWPLHTVLFINFGTIWHSSTQFYVQGHLRKKFGTDNANEIERYADLFGCLGLQLNSDKTKFMVT